MPTTWTNRDNVDPLGWNNRRVTSAPSPIGRGVPGFNIIGLFMDGVIFWRPRHVRFGEIYAGQDQWTERTKGSPNWSRR